MFRNAAAFEQNLCAWPDSYRYLGSGCANTSELVYARTDRGIFGLDGPWCQNCHVESTVVPTNNTLGHVLALTKLLLLSMSAWNSLGPVSARRDEGGPEAGIQRYTKITICYSRFDSKPRPPGQYGRKTDESGADFELWPGGGGGREFCMHGLGAKGCDLLLRSATTAAGQTWRSN
jgi:hypothetical protein